MDFSVFLTFGIMLSGFEGRLRCRANKFPCCCQSQSRNCTSPCTSPGAFLPPPQGVGGGAQLNAVWRKGTRAPTAPASPVTSNQQPHRRFSRPEAQVKHDKLPPRLPKACNSLSLQGFGLGGEGVKRKRAPALLRISSQNQAIIFWYPLGTHGWKVLKRLYVSH